MGKEKDIANPKGEGSQHYLGHFDEEGFYKHLFLSKNGIGNFHFIHSDREPDEIPDVSEFIKRTVGENGNNALPYDTVMKHLGLKTRKQVGALQNWSIFVLSAEDSRGYKAYR